MSQQPERRPTNEATEASSIENCRRKSSCGAIDLVRGCGELDNGIDVGT